MPEELRIDYDTNRPHKALNYRSPIELLSNALLFKTVNFEWTQKKSSLQMEELKGFCFSNMSEFKYF
jgi:hypothetical protein